MVNINEEQVKKIGEVLNNPNRPLKERFRALFTLRNIGGPIAIKCIENCFNDSSALLKHELAYCLGQMQDKAAIPALVKVLEDVKHEPMVRHEAAEALGAIGSEDVVPVLEKYEKDSTPEVAETCEIALGRIRWLKKNKNLPEKLPKNPFYSIDPAPPSQGNTVQELEMTFMDENLPIFDRYRAMFTLRNMRTQESVLALTRGLKAKSALFRHEVAFVLGQLQHEAAVPALRHSLEDKMENEMVRHECAEALGAVANDDCLEVLNKYLGDDQRVVKESCEIALDMCEYENSPEFQYANTLTKITS